MTNEVDKFGVMMVYQSANNGQDWYMTEPDVNKDNRLMLSSKSDWKVSDASIPAWAGKPGDMDPPSARVDCFTTNPRAKSMKEQLKTATDWTKLSESRHIIDDNDYLNFEATGYIHIDKKISERNFGKFTFYGRGGLHGKDWPEGCAGCCYKGVYDHNNQNTFFEKEYHHYAGHEGYAPRLNQKNSKKYSFKVGDWIGMKFIVYDVYIDGKVVPKGDPKDDVFILDGKVVSKDTPNAKYAVKCEIWIDKNSKDSIKDSSKQQWEIANVLIDDGNLPPPQARADEMVHQCHAISKTQVFNWGGPIFTWRSDDANLQYAKLSIREIKLPLPNGNI
jgi:hypothetical protein